MIPSFQTDRSELHEQFDQGLHCLPFHLQILDTILCGKTYLFKFYDD